MKIVTYLGFTLLSILIQFSVMDFIQDRLQLDEKPINLNGTSQKRYLRDVLKDMSFKPHALYYQTVKSKAIKNFSPAKLFSNTTLTELLATTDITTTVFDVLYDENTTATDETFTTESLYTTTEIENVTEITLLEKTNQTSIKSDTTPKTGTKDCSCNFLFRVCDINCCCDSDCSDTENKMFPNCVKNTSITTQQNDVCYLQLQYFGYGNGLFCIVKSNLPKRRNIAHEKIQKLKPDQFLSWKSIVKSRDVYEFSNQMYKYGDLVWLLKNGSIYYIDLPSPTINNYCTGRKPIQFLKNEKFSCNVKIRDLEMFQIIKSSEEAAVITATPVSINSSVLNCSSLHCTNWTILVCKNLICTNYNKDLHEPLCTESFCMNLATKVDYYVYYHESKITNATIQFHVENVSMDLPFMSQEIQVKFVLANESIDRILKLSGNPGYLDDLPVIVSYAEMNYSDTFYNNSSQTKNYLLLPENRNGVCLSFNNSNNFLLFGRNRRIKCRYNHLFVNLHNSTNDCKTIQNNIDSLLGFNNKILVSPLGDPQDLKDENWLSKEKASVIARPLYGEIQTRTSKLHCFNLITRYSIIFRFANINGNNRILSCKCETTPKNVSLSMEDMSTVVTIDVNFIDVTKPGVIEHAASPHLNIHIPTDFFYPFH